MSTLVFETILWKERRREGEKEREEEVRVKDLSLILAYSSLILSSPLSSLSLALELHRISFFDLIYLFFVFLLLRRHEYSSHTPNSQIFEYSTCVLEIIRIKERINAEKDTMNKEKRRESEEEGVMAEEVTTS